MAGNTFQINATVNTSKIFADVIAQSVPAIVTGARTEVPTDNFDGTYTFLHTPIIIFINGGQAEEGVNYTMDGLDCTPIAPSGFGLGLRSLY